MPMTHRQLAALACCGGLGVVAASALPGLAGLGLAGVPSPVDPLVTDLEHRYWEDIEPMLARYCFGCHGEDRAKGGVRFDGILTLGDALDMADEMALARELIQTRQMPPAGEGAPSAGEIEVLSRWIRDALDYVPSDGAIDPGWFIIHRLNRAEYRNTLRDLLGIDPRGHDLAAGLPQDDTGYGFDNIAAVLSMSPLQIEGYLDAAERALEIALGPAVVESDTPRPVRNMTNTTGGRPLPTGGFVLNSNGARTGPVEIPVTGEYEIAVTTWGERGGDELPRLSVRVDRREVAAAFVEGLRDTPQTERVRLRLEKGTRQIAAHFTNDFWQPGVADRNLAIEQVTIAGPLPGSVEHPPTRQSVLWSRPADDSVQAGRDAAAVMLERFASRAFRRAVRPEELAGLVNLYARARAEGDTHEESMRVALSAVLISPGFLYRSIDNPQADEPQSIYALSSHELASRLSYFLWSSTPDEELHALAVAGRLNDDAVLRTQVRRMLADPKADAFIENFAGQWLHLRNLDRLSIDRTRFPEYTSELRDAMITEAVMFFGDLVRNNRPVTELIDSKHTYLNGPLAALYGFADLAGMGDQFRRVDLPEDSPRGGILTMGAVLTVTSNPTRTSPVKRGLYVLEQILGTPPPPPPPEIPPLEQAETQTAHHASLREQLAAHLTDMTCASCHNRMDPLGLAMENFNAIGQWRDADESGPIDASGTLPGGVSFVGPQELKEILLGREDLFIENLTRKLMTYALGRGVEPFDRPTVARIVEHTRENGDQITAIIEGIVLSDAFRKARGVRR